MASGTLKIHVGQVRIVPGGKRKVYVRIHTTNAKTAACETRTAKTRSGLAADINDEVTFTVTEADEEILLQVYESVFGPDTLLGTARVSLWVVITEGAQALVVPILPPRGGPPVCEVALQMRFQLRDRHQQAALQQAGAAAIPPPQWQAPPPAQHQQQWQVSASQTSYPQQPQPAAMGYPAVGALSAPQWGQQEPTSGSQWGQQKPATPSWGQPQAPVQAPQSAVAPSPYPHDPLAYPHQWAPPAAAASPSSGKLAQQLPYPQQQPPYPQQPPAGYAQQAPYHSSGPQQLPTMPVVYGSGPPPNGGHAPAQAARPSKPGIGIGTALLGGLAAGLALDAIF